MNSVMCFKLTLQFLFAIPNLHPFPPLSEQTVSYGEWRYLVKKGNRGLRPLAPRKSASYCLCSWGSRFLQIFFFVCHVVWSGDRNKGINFLSLIYIFVRKKKFPLFAKFIFCPTSLPTSDLIYKKSLLLAVKCPGELLGGGGRRWWGAGERKNRLCGELILVKVSN
jgi:hypothetical protein